MGPSDPKRASQGLGEVIDVQNDFLNQTIANVPHQTASFGRHEVFFSTLAGLVHIGYGIALAVYKLVTCNLFPKYEDARLAAKDVQASQHLKLGALLLIPIIGSIVCWFLYKSEARELYREYRLLADTLCGRLGESDEFGEHIDRAAFSYNALCLYELAMEEAAKFSGKEAESVREEAGRRFAFLLRSSNQNDPDPAEIPAEINISPASFTENQKQIWEGVLKHRAIFDVESKKIPAAEKSAHLEKQVEAGEELQDGPFEEPAMPPSQLSPEIQALSMALKMFAEPASEHRSQKDASHKSTSEHPSQKDASHKSASEHSSHKDASHKSASEHSSHKDASHKSASEHSSHKDASHKSASEHSSHKDASHKSVSEHSESEKKPSYSEKAPSESSSSSEVSEREQPKATPKADISESPNVISETEDLKNLLAVQALELEEQGKYEEAADLFEQSGDFVSAAKNYQLANMDDKAFDCACKAFTDEERTVSLDEFPAPFALDEGPEALKDPQTLKADGDFLGAAQVFAAQKQWIEAADAFEAAGHSIQAAECIAKTEDANRCMEEGNQWVQTSHFDEARICLSAALGLLKNADPKDKRRQQVTAMLVACDAAQKAAKAGENSSEFGLKHKGKAEDKESSKPSVNPFGVKLNPTPTKVAGEKTEKSRVNPFGTILKPVAKAQGNPDSKTQSMSKSNPIKVRKLTPAQSAAKP